MLGILQPTNAKRVTTIRGRFGHVLCLCVLCHLVNRFLGSCLTPDTFDASWCRKRPDKTIHEIGAGLGDMRWVDSFKRF